MISFLSRQYIFSPKYFYFLIIFLNFGLKFNFMLTLIIHKPNLIFVILNEPKIFFVLGILEIIRCTLWNFLFLENEYLKQKGDFGIMTGFELPCNFDLNLDQGSKGNQFINEIMNRELDLRDQHLLFKTDFFDFYKQLKYFYKNQSNNRSIIKKSKKYNFL